MIPISTAYLAGCPPNVDQIRCFANWCTVNRCPAYPRAVCRYDLLRLRCKLGIPQMLLCKTSVSIFANYMIIDYEKRNAARIVTTSVAHFIIIITNKLYAGTVLFFFLYFSFRVKRRTMHYFNCLWFVFFLDDPFQVFFVLRNTCRSPCFRAFFLFGTRLRDFACSGGFPAI